MTESAVPILPSRNLEETLEFYSRLGFQLQGAPIEEYRYLIIGRGSIELHFWDAPNVDPFTTDASCYIRVDDADALHREWQGIGVQSDPATGSRLVSPVDTDYGIREFALVDQSGNLIRVGSPLRAAAD
jgi:catechol 2,3-dioxygenase-like lactoylglutathione lyase family enzyme